MKTKLLVIIIPILVIMGIVSVYIVVPLTAMNSAQQPPVQTTTSAEPQTTTPIYITTTLPVTTQRPVKTIIYTYTPPPIPETFAAEVSVFSQGIRWDVGINDTMPQVGGTVLIVIRMTNVNYSEPVSHPNCIIVQILNSEREQIDVIVQSYHSNPFFKISVNQTVTILSMWRLENTVRYANVEITPGEDYYIVVWLSDLTVEFGPIRVIAGS